jgi:hypothetical protein
MKHFQVWAKAIMGKSIFPLIFIICSACSQEIEKNIEQNYTLQKIDSLTIRLNKNGLATSDYQIRYTENDIQILKQNYGYRSISIYSVNEKKEIKEIKIDMNNLLPYFEKGSGLTGFFMKGEDSLFVMNFNSALVLIDTYTGNYLSKYSLETSNGNNNVRISTRFPFYYIKDKILFSEATNNFNQELFHELKLNEGIVTNFGEFSAFYKDNIEYLGGNWYDYLSHVQINDTTLIYGHPISQNLNFVNLTTKNIHEIRNEVNFPVNSHKSRIPVNSLSQAELDELISNTYNNYHYVNLMYNSNEELFYRLLKKPISPEIFNSFPKPLKYWKNNSELVIYDKNLKILGKTNELLGEYQIGIFNDSEIFNDGKNIYIKRIPENDEFITYDIYEINEKL